MSDFRFVEQKIVHTSAQKLESEGLTPNNSIILPQKHPKAKRACNACRRGKSRCDGRRPSCSRCASKGSGRNCVYEMETMKTQQYITFLENKVLELESRLIAQRSLEYKGSIGTSDTVTGTDELSLAKTDALVMVPSQERKPSESGGSSVTAFLHSISNSIGLDSTRDQACQFNVSADCLAQNTHPRKLQPEIPSLPPRRTADALMTKFWMYIHPIFPVLNEEYIELSYQSLWGSDASNSQKGSKPDGIERALFNIMFALGCQTGSEEESADHFYQKSRESYTADAIDLPSLSAVQLLVLTGVYLQSTKYASRCWTVVGMAIRYAQYLGIDAKDEEQASSPDINHAIQRRVWHSCVILDRLLSLSFNTSSMTPPQKVFDLSMIIPGSSGSQPMSQQRHNLTFFVHSAALFEIVNNTLIDIYHTPSSGIPAVTKSSTNHWWPREQLQQISAQNQALDDLSTTLPDYLEPSCDAEYSEGQQENVFRWQSYVFRSRFLYVRILVLRPLLLSAASTSVRLGQGILKPENTGRTTVEERNVRNCCNLCIDTLQHLVSHMSEKLEQGSNFARWREFHYSFVCAIAISVARLCYLDSGEFVLHDSWVRCVKILDYYKPRIQSAQRAMDMLYRLDARVTQLTKDTGRSSTPPSEAFLGEQAGSSLDSLGLTSLIEGSDPLGGLNPYDIDYAWLNSQAGSWGWFDH